MSNPLTIALLGAAYGSAFVHYVGYSGGEITPMLRCVLHDGLDEAINRANAHARDGEPESDAKPRRS